VYHALLDPKWSTTRSMSVARQDHTATLLSNGKCSSPAAPAAPPFFGAELYVEPRAWAATNSMTGARTLHTATQLGTSSKPRAAGSHRGRHNASSTLSTAQLYSPAAGT
jgi:hypothetical protein